MLGLQSATEWPVAFCDCHMTKGESLPVRWDTAKPRDAGIRRRDVRIESPCDGTGNDGGPFFLKKLDQLIVPRHQRVNLCGFAVEEDRDGFLLCQWGQGDFSLGIS